MQSATSQIPGAIKLDRPSLNGLIRRAVFHLGQCGLSTKDVAALCETNLGTLYQVMNRTDALPNAVDLVNLSRLASEYGFDDLASVMCSEWKAVRPIPHGQYDGSSED